MPKKVKLLGLIGPGLMLTLLIACSTLPTKPKSPEYGSFFLTCVRTEWQKGIHGECTKDALKDWMVLVGI